MNILYITTTGGTMSFFKELIRELVESGNTVDIVANESISQVSEFYKELGCKVFQMPWSRSSLNKGNISAIISLRKLVEEKNYDVVHCHTPIAAACTRIACRPLRKKGLKVIYTAHGFHFYKGAPLKNWLFYYPIEKLCAKWTDILITINREDYVRAQKRMRAGRVEYVPGVGIDVDKFANATVDRAAKRQEIGVPKDAFLLLSVGELNVNKNHQVVIRALAQLRDESIHYAIAGQGDMREELEQLAEQLGVAKQVHLLGFRTDVAELYKTADVDVFPSIREGLGLAALEGMAAGLPLICADNRGIRDYARHGENALVCPPVDVHAFAVTIDRLRDDEGLRSAMLRKATASAKKYDVTQICQQMKEIYGKM